MCIQCMYAYVDYIYVCSMYVCVSMYLCVYVRIISIYDLCTNVHAAIVIYLRVLCIHAHTLGLCTCVDGRREGWRKGGEREGGGWEGGREGGG